MSTHEPTGAFALMKEIEAKKKAAPTITKVGNEELTEAVRRFSEDRGEASYNEFFRVLGQVIDTCRAYVYLTVEEVSKASYGEEFSLGTLQADSGELVVIGTAEADNGRLDNKGLWGMSMYLGNIIDRVLADVRKPGVVLNPWTNGGIILPRSLLEQIFNEDD